MKDLEILNRELVCRIQKGEEVAFELLFKLYYKALHNFAFTYIKRIDLADEIVQETFIRIWEKRSTLDPDRSFKSFLYRCVHNHAVNYIKKLKVSARLSESYVNEIQYRLRFMEDLSESHFEKIAAEEMEITIQKAIDSLPAQCREVFLLSRFSYMSNTEIADKLMISVNTVKTQLSRALGKIRSSILFDEARKYEKL